MDWDAAIEKNRTALKRVLATLVAMARSGSRTPEAQAEGMGGNRQSEVGNREASDGVPTADCPLPTALSRHAYRAVLRLLRPAEAAARRLVIVAARGLVVTLPPMRAPKPVEPPRKVSATGSKPVVLNLGLAHWRPAPAPEPKPASRKLSLPLFDPPRHPFRVARRTVPPHAAPRILFPGVIEPRRLPPPPSPSDTIDATRLAARIDALARALDDLPREASRFARWRARRDAERARRRELEAAAAEAASRGEPVTPPAQPLRFRRLWPLRSGRPPGSPPLRSRLPRHEVHDILDDLHGLAFWVQRPDTS